MTKTVEKKGIWMEKSSEKKKKKAFRWLKQGKGSANEKKSHLKLMEKKNSDDKNREKEDDLDRKVIWKEAKEGFRMTETGKTIERWKSRIKKKGREFHVPF